MKRRHIIEGRKSTEMPFVRNLHQIERLPFPHLHVEAPTLDGIEPSMFKFRGTEDVRQNPWPGHSPPTHGIVGVPFHVFFPIIRII